MTICVDEYLAEIWLQTARLRQGEQFHGQEGRHLWQRCVEYVARAREAMQQSGITEVNNQHITYACCALLDEAVKSREIQDDASLEWYQSPLQTHFFNTLEAGEALYERMLHVLHEPAPDKAVLVCFHRVLMLGFLGGLHPDAPLRANILHELMSRIPAFRFTENQPVLNTIPVQSSLNLWLRDRRVRLSLGLLGAALLWWGLNSWLAAILRSFAA